MQDAELELITSIAATRSVLSRLFFYRLLHVVLSLIMLWLGYIYTDETPTFVTSPVYVLMAHIASEQTWGVFAFGIGSFGMATVFVRNWKVRTFAASVLSFAHAVMAFMFFAGFPNAPGAGLFLGYAILGAALTYRTANTGWRIADSLDSPDLPGSLAG